MVALKRILIKMFVRFMTKRKRIGEEKKLLILLVHFRWQREKSTSLFYTDNINQDNCRMIDVAPEMMKMNLRARLSIEEGGRTDTSCPVVSFSVSCFFFFCVPL